MKGSPLNNPQFKCSNSIHFPGAHVAFIEERFVETVAALSQHFISCFPTQFPEDDCLPAASTASCKSFSVFLSMLMLSKRFLLQTNWSSGVSFWNPFILTTSPSL
ncbi:hypothetical protein H5410_050052 [Solanum commersonii]|uniref:Uncharacterized protein n=1 Tax=Solanum commersonii TaxID=4109 RepID=A0A9J5WUD9_SOLCO|nr:hypothetical protein H5410_050052 [Solanum commersonii]